jgi:hypothetical protein
MTHKKSANRFGRARFRRPPSSIVSRFTAFAVCAGVLLCSACGGSDTATTPGPTSTAGTDTFASLVTVGGTAAHTFPVDTAGTITMTLTAATPSIPLGLAIGIPGEATSICSLSRSVEAAAGAAAQLTVDVDPGSYCVEVYDTGHVTDPGASFSVTIVHP